MKFRSQQLSLLCFVFSYLTIVHCKGSGGGGGGGRGAGGGRGLGRSAAVIVGSGAAGYAAYKAHQNLKQRTRGDKESNPDFDSFDEQYLDADGKFDYKTQESTSYYATEGIGMSAWTLLFLIFGVIFLGTVAWYCCNVFFPVWEDNRQMRRRSMMGRLKDEVPLQETPSTATPSP